MKPLHLDFTPRRSLSTRLSARLSARPRWLAGGAGALLLVVSSAAWLLTPAAEAGSMVASGMASSERRPLPGREEIQAVDAATGKLNFPWLAALDALENTFDSRDDGLLLSAEADPRRATIRVSGQARDAGLVAGLPVRLRRLPEVADAVLLGQERQDVGEGAAAHPVRFSLELRLKEAS